jgi:phage tail sheath protein FI
MGQLMRGWDLYRDVEHIDVNILIQGGKPPGMNVVQDIADVQRYMASLAEERMDAIAVLDVPSDLQETANAVAYRREDLNLDSSYAAMYSPDVWILDKFNDIELYVPPSGFAASVYALTDRVANVWFGPAGMTRGNLSVLKSRYVYKQGHRNALTDAQINAIRFFPNGAGYKVWGTDTMQVMASALSNVAVRRLLNMIEKAIRISNMYSVFDPNDQVLCSRLTSIVNGFLQPIKDAGGLYWFQVVCDDTNNPPSSIADGVLNMDAYFDPTITTKRIRLNANIVKTGTSYREYLTARS